MGLTDIIDRVKSYFRADKNSESEPPPREIRDKHLESLEREWQYYEMQKRKELLKKKLMALKKKQTRERAFGIGVKPVIHPSILKAKLEESRVDLTREKYQILKQKKMFKG